MSLPTTLEFKLKMSSTQQDLYLQKKTNFYILAENYILEENWNLIIITFILYLQGSIKEVPQYFEMVGCNPKATPVVTPLDVNLNSYSFRLS